MEKLLCLQYQLLYVEQNERGEVMFYIGLAVGLFIGVAIGFFTAALMVIGKKKSHRANNPFQ